ncbi:hypothetical protein EV132_106124 [Rhizobium sullae]|uniref:Uncharacterized protein n=1 Tax=Rhizobium sullae TaxID=50338 RepID=A0A4R3Q8T3_RHISU|nr:hypothetical protein EV132_106124 [Rhizobium sullae]
MIEARAKMRLAEEYDAAQDRGEVAKVGQPSIIPDQNNKPVTAKDIDPALPKLAFETLPVSTAWTNSGVPCSMTFAALATDRGDTESICAAAERSTCKFAS